MAFNYSNLISSGGQSYWPSQWSSTPQQSTYSWSTTPVLSSNIPSGGRSSGGGQQSAPAGNPTAVGFHGENPPMQNAPSQPEVDWNAMYAPAFGALGQYEQTLQPQYETTVKEAEQGTATKKTGAEQQLAEKVGQYNLQRTRETGRTKSTVAEARRLAAEMMQGIQSRYGGTTGTGAFSSEILGSQATRNISQQQTALQDVLGQIGQEESNVRNQTTQYINQLDQQLALDKEKARNQLQAALANVAQMRGQLESEKASQKLNLLKEYNNQLQQIDASNTQFKQQLYNNWQQQQYQLDTLKAKAVNQYSAQLTNFEPSLFNVGNKSYAAVPYNPGIRYLPGSTTEDQNTEDWTNNLQ